MDDPSFDPYATLEVTPRANAKVIKAAYHALIREHHPDKTKGEPVIAMALNAAYEMLSDPERRAEYDDTVKKNVGKGTLIGDYRVLEEIATGGFGTTYKGEHIIVKEPVCIKHCSEISAAHDAVLIQEAKSNWDLRHYALPAMRSMYRLEDGSLALIMSYIKGPTLEQIVEKAGRIEPETVMWITERVLNALLYLHMHGVIHGDIKPQNIIIQPETHSVVLVDFGLAVVKPSSSTKSLGYTPYFAPPEQVAGGVLLPASDFYSLGALMIYALGGGSKALSRMQVPDDVPTPLCKFVKKLVMRDILLRPQEDFSDEFQQLRMSLFGRRRSGMKPIPGF